MPLTLEVVGPKAAKMGAGARKAFQGSGTIGRLRDNDWVFPDEYISGHHAKILFANGGFLIEDTSTGRVRNVPGFGPQVFYHLNDQDAARVVRGVELTAQAMFAAGARRVLLPFDGTPAMHSLDEVRRLLARPVPKQSIRLYSIHLMGTARMSEDPRRGVVDSFGQFHGRPGLFIADASIFPGPTGLNPMETVIALATRNARHLIDHRTAHHI